MNSMRTVILLIIVFIIGVSLVYWLYQSQIATNEEELLPFPEQTEQIDEFASPTPEPQLEVEQSVNQFVPDIQPEAGSNTTSFYLTEPKSLEKITSPVTVKGQSNIHGELNINIKDLYGNLLGNSAATCLGSNICSFECSSSYAYIF